jgi:hypothetical protein
LLRENSIVVVEVERKNQASGDNYADDACGLGCGPYCYLAPLATDLFYNTLSVRNYDSIVTRSRRRVDHEENMQHESLGSAAVLDRLERSNASEKKNAKSDVR